MSQPQNSNTTNFSPVASSYARIGETHNNVARASRRCRDARRDISDGRQVPADSFAQCGIHSSRMSVIDRPRHQRARFFEEAIHVHFDERLIFAMPSDFAHVNVAARRRCARYRRPFAARASKDIYWITECARSGCLPAGRAIDI